jgi:hypothetical protein
MRTAVRAGFIVALIGAVVGLLSGLGGLFGGPVHGALILGAVGFICGFVNKTLQRKFYDRAR